jgi:hypothetical protein
MDVGRRVALASLLLLGAAACSSEDDRPATFAYVYTTIIQPSCTTIGCHNRLTQTYGFRFGTLEGAYVLLTGQVCDGLPPDPAGEAPSNFVIPGQPDRSKLVYLLRGEDVPLRMPPDRAIPEVDIELVERWILEGAQCD